MERNLWAGMEDGEICHGDRIGGGAGEEGTIPAYGRDGSYQPDLSATGLDLAATWPGQAPQATDAAGESARPHATTNEGKVAIDGVTSEKALAAKRPGPVRIVQSRGFTMASPGSRARPHDKRPMPKIGKPVWAMPLHQNYPAVLHWQIASAITGLQPVR